MKEKGRVEYFIYLIFHLLLLMPFIGTAAEISTEKATFGISSENRVDVTTEDNGKSSVFAPPTENKEGEYDAEALFQEGDNIFDFSLKIDELELQQEEPANFSLIGFFKEELGYSYQKDLPYFSTIRSTLNIKMDYRLMTEWKFSGNWNGFYDYAYQRRGRENFTTETLKAHESELEIRDLFIDGALSETLRLKLGRQVIAWGEADYSQISDQVNPRDMRELGLVDMEDTRIPITATKLSWLNNGSEINLVALHEFRGHKMAGKGSEFDPMVSVREMGITVKDEELPVSKIENTELAIRYYRVLNGGDISFVFADAYDDNTHLEFYEMDMRSGTPKISVTPSHKRIKTLAASLSVAKGAWLWKSELGKQFNKALPRDDIDSQIAKAQANPPASGVFEQSSEAIQFYSIKDLYLFMLGTVYSGFSNVTLGIELLGEHIESYEENLSSEKLSGMVTFNGLYKALNETLSVQWVWTHFFNRNGDLFRFTVDYDIVDALKIIGGFIDYQAEDSDGKLYHYRNNDRLYMSLKYSF